MEDFMVCFSKFISFLNILNSERHSSVGGGSFFVGDGLTYADVMLYDIVDTYRRLALDKQAIREAYPSLMGFVEKFESNLRIKAYINSSRRAPNPNGKAAFVDNEGAK